VKHADAAGMAPNLTLRPARRTRHVKSRRSALTAGQLVETLDALDVPPRRLARLLGVNERTVQRWTTGRSTIPCSVQLALFAYRVAPWTRVLRGPVPLGAARGRQRYMPRLRD
jgi:hypothetical protein